MYNAVIRALQTLGLADAFGASRVPIYCMNVTYPMIPEEIVEFCAGKKRSADRRGRPARLHRGRSARHLAARTTSNDVKVRGKDVLPMAGEYTGEVVLTRNFEVSRIAKPPSDSIKTLKSKGGRSARRRCPRARRASASAARSGRCSRR